MEPVEMISIRQWCIFTETKVKLLNRRKSHLFLLFSTTRFFFLAIRLANVFLFKAKTVRLRGKIKVNLIKMENKSQQNQKKRNNRMLKLSRNATDPLNAYFRVDLIDDRNGIWKKNQIQTIWTFSHTIIAIITYCYCSWLDCLLLCLYCLSWCHATLALVLQIGLCHKNCRTTTNASLAEEEEKKLHTKGCWQTSIK